MTVLLFFITACQNNEEEVPKISIVESTKAMEKPKETTEEDVVPLPEYNSYDVNIEAEPETGILKGVEKVVFTNKTGASLNKIYFHVPLNAFKYGHSPKPYFENFESKIFENGKDYGYMEIISIMCDNEEINFDISGTILKLDFLEKIEINEIKEIRIQFLSYIPKINARTGRNDKALWFGNFLPTLVVYDEDEWNTNDYYPAGDPFYTEIANYNVSIKTPIEYKVIGTGSEVVKENEKDREKITTMSQDLVRDFAFVISDSYKSKSLITKNGAEISFYYYSEDAKVDLILESVEKSIEYYSELVADYPFDRMDIVETGLFGRIGMEYPEIIFLDSSIITKTSITKTVAHEIGHQWFYNLVGNNQVEESWLDEGITSFLQEGVFLEKNEIEKKIKEDYIFVKSKLNSIEDGRIGRSLETFKSWSEYYNIEYLKTKLMFYALYDLMGAETFDRFLKEYYSRFSFKTVKKADFISLTEEIYGKSLTSFFKNWLESNELPKIEKFE